MRNDERVFVRAKDGGEECFGGVAWREVPGRRKEKNGPTDRFFSFLEEPPQAARQSLVRFT
jgi:hypothetical protein